MSHTIKDKAKLLNRVRRIRGQVEAIERALETDAGCAPVMHLIAGCRGAIHGLLAEVVEEHIRSHLVAASDAEPAAVDDLVELVHAYWK